MKISIIGYGAYLPRYRIKGELIAQAQSSDWGKVYTSLAVGEKTVPGIDEDTATLSVAAASNALARAGIAADKIDAVYVGSESHPYAVKPTATIVTQALGTNLFSYAADLEFACKAGTAALISSCAIVGSGVATHALAIGADTAQAAPGDVLEYTAAAGGAAFIVACTKTASNKNTSKAFPLGEPPRSACLGLATIEHTCSITTDTPDFWRRAGQPYPEHTGRFTAEPSYLYHVQTITQKILNDCGLKPADIDHVVFHQPNARLPQAAARKLGFTQAQLGLGFLVPEVGNTYSASTLLGLTAVLDQAQADQLILVVSYGSGSGADALLLRTTQNLLNVRSLVPSTADYIAQKEYVTYQQYRRFVGGK